MTATEKLTAMSWVTPNDVERSATVQMIGSVARALAPLRGKELGSMLDIGCGFGGLTRSVADYIGAREVYGIDVDTNALAEAETKGVRTRHVDVANCPLPFDDGSLGLVISFGMFDYLPFYDSVVKEIARVVTPDGFVLVSLPNLASWHNRLFLMMGYQPRDVEVSNEKLVGVHPWYNADEVPTGHVHTVTVPAFEELMCFHGFTTVRIIGARPGGRNKPALLHLIDRLMTRRPTLARRFFYLGQKPKSGSR